MSYLQEKSTPRIRITSSTFSKLLAKASTSNQTENVTPKNGRSFTKSKFSLLKNSLFTPKPSSIVTSFTNYQTTAAKQVQNQKQLGMMKKHKLFRFSIDDRVRNDESSNDGTKLIIKSSIKLRLKPAEDETEEQKKYTRLVKEYKNAMKKAPKKPPKVNYTELLKCIKIKMEELDNPQLRYEMIKRRIRGSVDKCVWDTEKVIESVNDLYHATKRKKNEKNMTVDLEQMNKEQIDRFIIKEMEENKRRKLEQEIRVRTIRNRNLSDKGGLQLFKEKVNNCLETIRSNYNVPIKQWVRKDMLNINAFTKKYAKPFFISVKNNSTETAMALLELNPNLVYDINNVTL